MNGKCNALEKAKLSNMHSLDGKGNLNSQEKKQGFQQPKALNDMMKIAGTPRPYYDF